MWSRRNKALLALAATLATLSLALYFTLSGAPRSQVSDETIRTAERIVDDAGGGEQPRDPGGVPLDAVVDPSHKPGRIERTLPQ